MLVTRAKNVRFCAKVGAMELVVHTDVTVMLQTLRVVIQLLATVSADLAGKVGKHCLRVSRKSHLHFLSLNQCDLTQRVPVETTGLN